MKDPHLAAATERTVPENKPGLADMAKIMQPGFLRRLIAPAAEQQIPLRRIAMRRYAGFTLIELILVAAILAVLVAIAVPSYADYQDRIKFAQAKSDIKQIEVLITRYYADNNFAFPTQLSDVGAGTMLDPWGNPYQYCELASGAGTCKTRKDKSLHPLNSDYDLCSMGRDGDTKVPLTAQASHDDIIRARNGQFLGYASDF